LSICCDHGGLVLPSTDRNQELVAIIERTIRTEFDEAVKSFWSAAKTDATEQQRKDATNGIKGMFYNKKYDGLLPTEMR
jgi:hypothetical protein